METPVSHFEYYIHNQAKYQHRNKRLVKHYKLSTPYVSTEHCTQQQQNIYSSEVHMKPPGQNKCQDINFTKFKILRINTFMVCDNNGMKLEINNLRKTGEIHKYEKKCS